MTRVPVEDLKAATRHEDSSTVRSPERATDEPSDADLNRADGFLYKQIEPTGLHGVLRRRRRPAWSSTTWAASSVLVGKASGGGGGGGGGWRPRRQAVRHAPAGLRLRSCVRRGSSSTWKRSLH
ncbi:hypothetical protein ACP70R_027320 [Stipagrostis hirtigluma subsp. patula]